MTDAASTQLATEGRTAPLPIYNRPGLSQIGFRIGTHSAFLRAMERRLAGLSLVMPFSETDALRVHSFGMERVYPFRGFRRRRYDRIVRVEQDGVEISAVVEPGEWGALEQTRPGLTTRSPDDPSIALLDAWATVADVLTFYQERIANEGYLRTALERRSVLELARLVGYALRPGVAATVYLAYTIDEKFTDTAIIDSGARVQSVPAPGQLPQTFETSDKLHARAAWNRLQPRLTRPQQLDKVKSSGLIYFKGVATNLKPNDALLAPFPDRADGELFRVVTVDVDRAADRTKVTVLPWNGVWSIPVDDAERVYTEELAKLLADVTSEDNVKDFNVDPEGITAQEVTNALALFSRSLSKALAQGRVDASAVPVAAALRRQLNDARVARHTNIARWVADSLERWQRLAEQHHRAGPLVGLGDPLLGVMAGLSIPPSQPPANAYRLSQSLGASFAPRSDAGVKALAAAQPELGAQVNAALANVQAAPDNPLEVYALRLKAGVYGNTAPPRSVLDEKGRAKATEDWPLNPGVLSVGLTLPPNEQTDIYVAAAGLTVGRQTFESQVPLPRDKETADLELGDETVTVHYPNTGRAGVYTFRFSDGRTVAIEVAGGNAASVGITLDVAGVEQSLTLVRGQSASRSTKESRLRASYGTLLNDNGRPNAFQVIVENEEYRPASPLNAIDLDGVYEQATPQQWAAIIHPQRTIVTTITAARAVGRNSYNFPAKVTELTLAAGWLNEERWLAEIKDTVVLTHSEKLELAGEPIEEPICGADQWIELDGIYSELKAGRWAIVAGERADIQDASGNTVSGLLSQELVMLAEVQHDVYRGQTDPNLQAALRAGGGQSEGLPEEPGDRNHTFIKFATPLQFCYRRDKVTIYGNVVRATHGETRNEPLGSGDGSKEFQSFILRQPPLTYVSAPNPAGVGSTLEVFVNDIRWNEAPGIAGLQKRDRAYLTRTSDDGKTTVIFGDGRQGARLPTGVENIRARYRTGIGKPGNVQAEQITNLQTRPLGVKSVINPLRASGGADPEGRDQARRNAPLAVLALDRLVSVQDYADFARTFGGIGKAHAARLSDGKRQLLHLTIAGAGNSPIDPSSDVFRNLMVALREYGDVSLPVQLDTRELILIVLQARVAIAPDREWEIVAQALKQKLYQTFSFDERELGQDVLLSHVLSVMHSVPGVTFVDVDILGGVEEKTPDAQGVLRLRTPEEINGAVQLLVADKGHKQPLARVSVALAGGQGALHPAQLALLLPEVPDTLILNLIP
jgi:predicted phage baseplate assembly protein